MSDRQLRRRSHGRVISHDDEPRNDVEQTASLRSRASMSARPKAKPRMKSTRRLCSICSEVKPSDQFPDKITSICRHKQDMCQECVKTSLRMQIQAKNWAFKGQKLTCPICPSPLTEEDVQCHADDETRARYKHLTARAENARNEDYYFCQAADCNSGQQHDDTTKPMECRACGFKSCVECGGAWHPTKTCAQQQKSMKKKHGKEEQQSELRLSQSARQCPGEDCSVMFEQDGGCSHMVCTTCNTEFCSKCLVLYADIRKGGSSAHTKDCPNHPDNQPQPLPGFANGTPLHGRFNGGPLPGHAPPPNPYHVFYQQLAPRGYETPFAHPPPTAPASFLQRPVTAMRESFVRNFLTRDADLQPPTEPRAHRNAARAARHAARYAEINAARIAAGDAARNAARDAQTGPSSSAGRQPQQAVREVIDLTIDDDEEEVEVAEPPARPARKRAKHN